MKLLKVKRGWDGWVFWQREDHSLGFSLTFARHEDKTMGFWVQLECLFLFTVAFGWNWY